MPDALAIRHVQFEDLGAFAAPIAAAGYAIRIHEAGLEPLPQRDAEEADYWAQRGNGFIWPNWFAPMGFNEALRNPGETGELGGTYDWLKARGFEFVGTPDQINRQMEKLVTLHDPEYLLHWMYSGPIPNDVVCRSIELWQTEIAPNWV